MSLEFWLTALIVTVTPGTGVLYTVSVGITRGQAASVAAAVGCTLGIVPHLAAAIYGAAALLRASGLAFEVLRYAGVAYLLYMAWRTLRDTGSMAVGQQRPRSFLRIITSAVLINLLNPKLTLFFFALLPQFVDEARAGATWQMTQLGAIVHGGDPGDLRHLWAAGIGCAGGGSVAAAVPDLATPSLRCILRGARGETAGH